VRAVDADDHGGGDLVFGVQIEEFHAARRPARRADTLRGNVRLLRFRELAGAFPLPIANWVSNEHKRV
jgi:hypothetical protein